MDHTMDIETIVCVDHLGSLVSDANPRDATALIRDQANE
jgi:hypothetical protein